MDGVNKMERSFSADELKKAREAIYALLADTWDGDWSFWKPEIPNAARDLLISMDLWLKIDDENIP